MKVFFLILCLFLLFMSQLGIIMNKEAFTASQMLPPTICRLSWRIWSFGRINGITVVCLHVILFMWQFMYESHNESYNASEYFSMRVCSYFSSWKCHSVILMGQLQINQITQSCESEVSKADKLGNLVVHGQNHKVLYLYEYCIKVLQHSTKKERKKWKYKNTKNANVDWTKQTQTLFNRLVDSQT